MPAPEQETPEELRWIEAFTRLMDNKFRIPGTHIRFGLDPVLGLVPFFGELVAFGLSGLLMLAMVRKGVSGKVVAMMLGNLLVDLVLGLVPIAGDLLDVAYKANLRNYKLLKKHYAEGKYKGSAWPLVLGAGTALFVLLLLLGGLSIWVVSKLIGLLFN